MSLIGMITLYEHEMQYEIIVLPIVDGKVSSSELMEVENYRDTHAIFNQYCSDYLHLRFSTSKYPAGSCGQILKKYRKLNGLIQAELAEK